MVASRIYLQPDAVPTQAMIRTANRLFRHFGKEVTFLTGLELAENPTLTMNRLRWKLISSTDLETTPFENAVLDLTETRESSNVLIKTQFDASSALVNLVVIDKNEKIIEMRKNGS
ncbi:MAG: hypothetical protein LBI11_02895 [Streptococcaceae bacterium]|jgi:hypothetical protein|nr:hypothetical protein [Streptococcaceae bacterium]